MSKYIGSNLIAKLSKIVSGIEDKLSGFYTKDETETFVDEQITNANNYTNSRLEGYYTKDETDAMIGDINNALAAIIG